MAASTATIGFPRIGPNRELKKCLEEHWKGNLSAIDLAKETHKVEEGTWHTQVEAGVDLVGVGDFNLYDQVNRT